MTDPSRNYHHLFKLLIVGDSGVGKSSILLRYIDDEFNEKQLSTIGVDFKVRYTNIAGRRIKLAVWDTAGQERFRTLTSSYYRGAQGIILAYDTTSRVSFDNIRSWLDEVKRYSTNTEAVKMLIANKIDMRSASEVERKEGEQFAFENSMLFIETSAKTKEGIVHAFDELVHKIVDTPCLLVNTSPIEARAHQPINSDSPLSSPSPCSC